jgi:putative glutamine amidotransferase
MPDPSSFNVGRRDAPRIGIPYRLAGEERVGSGEEIQPYVKAVEAAGGEARIISLFLSPDELGRLCAELDAVVLPGSPADVDPARYGAAASPETAEADPRREQTDTSLLDWAFRAAKPVLGICYGTQLLNVYCGGTLVQDIRGELHSSLTHEWAKKSGAPEPHHPVRLVPGSRLAQLAETGDTIVNSSHHQSIRRPGRGLRVTAKAPDGVVEAVELESAAHWVVGAQWHPERQQNRMPGKADSGARLAAALFSGLVRAAREARDAPIAPKTERRATGESEEG